MFLERLEPPKASDYDPPSSGSESEVEDKLATIQDLSLLLLPQHPSSKNEATGDSSSDTSEHKYSLNVARVNPTLCLN